MEKVVGFSMGKTVDDMIELLKFVSLPRNESMCLELNHFLESGQSSFIVTKTDIVIAGDTEEHISTYKLAEPLEVLLATARAGNVNANVI